MLLSIPQLQDYGLSPVTGFLPQQPPLSRLPQKYYKPWETVMESLTDLLLTARLKEVVDDMPLLEIDELRNDAQRRRAFLILSFLAHAYVWGETRISTYIPASIAVPWDAVASELEVKPICTHASLCLWNWRPLFANEPLSLKNLATQHTFTGSVDESWFYLVSTAMEARGAPTLPIILQAIRAARAGSIAEVTYNLRALAIHIDDMAVALTRMHDNCDPHIFYHKIRPFLAGWKNMADAGLPNGMRYEGCENSREGLYRKYAGGSNAQSALIHMLDISLGVEHREANTTQADAEKKRNEFMDDMRNYMPAQHRRFLEHLAKVVNLRTFCLANKNDLVLSEAYDACIAMLKVFRDKHLAIVTRFIVLPASKSRQQPANIAKDMPRQAKGLAALVPKDKTDLRGTGGTNLMSFLKQSRDETGHMAVSTWAKNLSANGYGSVDLADADHRVFISLTGSYGNEWSDGGLCI